MAFKIAESEWVSRESGRVWGVLQIAMKHDISYTGQQLLDIIGGVGGFNYTQAEIVTLRDELVSQGKLVIV